MNTRVAIFGGGRVGTAMAAEMPGAPVLRGGQDCECDVACICWPAQAILSFNMLHPKASGATKVAFCNGVWAEEDGADHAGICYVRAVHLGDLAKPGRKGWRVGSGPVANALRAAGLGVVCSRGDHLAELWGKALYLLPLALACAEHGGLTGRTVTDKEEYAEWYDVVRRRAVAAIGEDLVASREPRVKFLISRTPRGWCPSPSSEELEYFRAKLCAD